MQNMGACPCTGTTLGRLVQPAVLTALAKGPQHGYRIASTLGGLRILGGTKPDTTGVYRVLKSMERSGLVRAAWDRSEAGPRKRLYRLTPSGRACLARWITTLETYQEAVGELLHAAAAAAVPRRRKKTDPA